MGKYDYSMLSEPIRWDSKINVICPNHGVFTIMVNNHYRGAGCIICSGTKRKSRDERIKEAKAIHGERYDYSLVGNDVRSRSKIDILCHVHGVFTQTVASHINVKTGCPKCSNRIERTYSKFIKQSFKVHGDRYWYKHYSSVKGCDEIPILCKEHGVFTQTVGAHLAGKGCQACGSNSIDQDEEAYVYILKSDGIFKVGVSSRIDSRLSTLKTRTPFDFHVAHIKKFKTRKEAFASEKEILNSFESACLYGFDGATEWLIGDPCL